ncbi:MAG: hybrid sensor histidine kinase/response regulator [Chloroflexi bacterium]|nr:MAG: hybrid sensor histidine kinase/response regulator [Chloroflexota bacterium]
MTHSQNVILIIDDHPTNLGVLFEALEHAGHKVFIHTRAQTALDVIPEILPDLILLDVMMPGLDGFETCRRLKANPATQDIPVIFMTALNDVVDEVRGFELGAVDYIVKPIQVEKTLARVNAHLTIRKLQKQLETKNAELDAFAHTVAHNLKNPLGNMVAYANYLTEFSETITSDDLAEFAQGIEQSAQHTINIVNELLLLANVRKGTVSAKPLDMAAIVGRAKERLVLEIESAAARISEPDVWPVAVGHAPWVEEVWVNYLSNGLKYGGRPPQLVLGAAPEGDGQICFWVQDNGAGIPAEEQPALFTEFTRLNQVRTKGHGLGLSIVRRIVERLGGRVGVKNSTAGQGSTFFFTLPGNDLTE